MYKFLIFSFILISSCAQSQDDIQYQLIGGPCEGCEAIFEVENYEMNDIDTLPEYSLSNKKLLLTGTIYQSDGKTPAENVILYIYHTNSEGIYPTKGKETGWAQRHGYLRGWIKTDSDGRYTFYTSKPSPYPNRKDPAHIHLTVLEPDGSYYWIHDTLFEDDPLVSQNQRNDKTRGGYTGIIALQMHNEILIGKRDIILRKNL